MALTTSKWMYLVIGIALLSAVLYLTGRKTFHAEIEIPATPEKVWSVLTDEAGYRHWNPLLVPSSGEIAQGNEIVYQMTQPNGKQSEFTSRVLRVEEARLIKQFAGMPLILTVDHEWRLEAVEGGTLAIQHEVDNGVAMLFWDSSWVQPSYERVNEALRARVLELAK